VKLPGRKRIEAAEPESSEKSRLCPECGMPVSSRATTCANCGHDFVAAIQAKQIVQAEQQEEAAQRPVRAIAIGVTAAIVMLLIAALYFRNRAAAIAALTPTVTPTSTRAPTATPTPTPTPTPPFTATPLPPREYTVQPGDTIFYIADIYQVDYTAILAYNGLSENSILQVNQKILIPPPTPTPSPTRAAVTLAVGAAPTEIIHVVQSGETLIAIAQEYGVPTSVILDANNIVNPDLIKAGDRLIIPQGPTPTPVPEANAATTLPSYGPVTLLQPLNGDRIVGNDRTVLLQWLSAGILRNEETYRVTIEQVDGSIRYGPVYIKATGLHLPIELFPAPDDPQRAFRWTVTIMRQVGVGSDGTPLYDVISPPVSRTFHWITAPPTPTLTPVPQR